MKSIFLVLVVAASSLVTGCVAYPSAGNYYAPQYRQAYQTPCCTNSYNSGYGQPQYYSQPQYQQQYRPPVNVVGGLVGAGVGGLVGAQFGRGRGRVAAAVLGAGVGGVIGSGM